MGTCCSLLGGASSDATNDAAPHPHKFSRPGWWDAEPPKHTAVRHEIRSMALAPAGVELIQPVPFFLPVFKLDQVHVFPGDPAALRLLFNGWKGALSREPYHSARIKLDLDEGEVAPLLTALADAHPGVEVGSYPRFDSGRTWKVLVTIDAKDLDAVNAAASALADRIQAEFGQQAILDRAGPGSTEV